MVARSEVVAVLTIIKARVHTIVGRFGNYLTKNKLYKHIISLSGNSFCPMEIYGPIAHLGER